jgi:hypothetical protein
MTGSWTISDAATSNPQSIVVSKPNGTITVTSGQVSVILNKNDQSFDAACQSFTLQATTSAEINSPKVAIGNGSIELLDQITQLITALGNVIPMSPIGPCAPLMATSQWTQVQQIQSKIDQIKGSLS